MEIGAVRRKRPKYRYNLSYSRLQYGKMVRSRNVYGTRTPAVRGGVFSDLFIVLEGHDRF